MMASALFAVEDTDHLWIGMSDGVRLAARMWRPQTNEPVPAILEYIPYRKADMVRARDERNHPFFAAHGYACIRVDMRGSGDSEGQMPDMYAPAELDDARQVIEWLAAQPWCNGCVGMFGTSWGGTAALQASVNAPEALKAVIAVCATHDRFEDDIHYMGGSVLTDTFEWGATLPAILASPPTPHMGEDWKERWRARIERLTCPLDNWLREQGRGAYWRFGSVAHEAKALSVPTLAVGGWSDRYSNSVMAFVDARPDLVWGVIGPWGHHYPDHAAPGPGIGFQHLALEWWDHHLATERKEPIAWPRLRSWLREFDMPRDRLETRRGRWIESDAPAQETKPVDLSLQDLATKRGPWRVPSDPQIGITSGDTGYFGRAGGLPADQSRDDARSLVFETEPLQQDVSIYGAIVLSVCGRLDGEPARLVVRVSDVAPDGVACRISYGLRNLALDDALDIPTAPRDEAEFSVSIPLHSVAYRVQKSHQLRIAISVSLWPLVWSSGAVGAVDITSGFLKLPVLKDGARDLHVPLPEVKDLPQIKSHTVQSAPSLERWVEVSETHAEVGWHQPKIQVVYHHTDTAFSYETRMVHVQAAFGPTFERVSVDHEMEFIRPDGRAVVTARLEARSVAGAPHTRLNLTATWNGEEIGMRAWTIPALKET